MKTESALDKLTNWNYWTAFTTKQIGEADAHDRGLPYIREEKVPFVEFMDGMLGVDKLEIVKRASAELAQLRAELDEARKVIENVVKVHPYFFEVSVWNAASNYLKAHPERRTK